ncbi:hypothetical protein [Aeromonas veronii]|uniref:hypothetical protein n=1 Tax=Aeromonas veronii TaxID=654 RepID=UPI002445208B|nr:hypothetical protein [Aeromonas veronii]
MHAINTDSVGELYNGIGRIDDLETMAKKLAQEKINSIIETTQALDSEALMRVLDAIDQAGRGAAGGDWRFGTDCQGSLVQAAQDRRDHPVCPR